MVANPAHRVVNHLAKWSIRSWRSLYLLVHSSWRLTTEPVLGMRPNQIARRIDAAARHVSATRRAYRRLPASASTARYPPQLRHEDRTHGWFQPLHQRCHQEVGGRGGVNGHNARSGQILRRCRPQRRRNSSQDCDSAIQKAHPTSDGEMEGGPEGEAQGAVHPWDRPGTEHTQRHREEVHECRKPTHVARPRNVGSALVLLLRPLQRRS